MLTHYLKRLTQHTPLDSLTAPLQQLAALPRRLTQLEPGELADEPKLLAAACRLLLLPQASAVDVGADAADALALFQRVAPQGRHVAFEPQPHRAKRLRRKYPGVDVRETALLEGAWWRQDAGEPGRGAEAPDVLQAMRGARRSLDELIGPEHPVDLLRLEAHGAELFVMMGAELLLARCRPSLVFRSRLAALQQWELRPQDVFDYLSDLGYRVFLPRAFVTCGRPLSRDEFAEAHAPPLLASSFVATAPERVCGRRLVHPHARPSQRVPLAGQATVA